jgi:hypothetical protein
MPTCASYVRDSCRILVNLVLKLILFHFQPIVDIKNSTWIGGIQPSLIFPQPAQNSIIVQDAHEFFEEVSDISKSKQEWKVESSSETVPSRDWYLRETHHTSDNLV